LRAQPRSALKSDRVSIIRDGSTSGSRREENKDDQRETSTNAMIQRAYKQREYLESSITTREHKERLP
jgi:ABC-type sugar transport system ATPase subunit